MTGSFLRSVVELFLEMNGLDRGLVDKFVLEEASYLEVCEWADELAREARKVVNAGVRVRLRAE